MRKQRVALKHGVDRSLVRLRLGYIFATDKNLSGGWLFKPSN